MLIWHIDYLRTIWDRNSCSNNANHQYVDIEEADNIKTEATRDGDAFPAVPMSPHLATTLPPRWSLGPLSVSTCP